MKFLCAWCGKGLKPETPEGAGIVSHGICLECKDFLLANRASGLREFITRLEIPVLLVDGNVRVQAGNEAASSTLAGKTEREIEEKLGGQVLECVNARLPGGCGNTLCCVGCALRKSVTHTFATGEALHNIESIHEIDGEKRTRFKIVFSTLRSADSVALVFHSAALLNDI